MTKSVYFLYNNDIDVKDDDDDDDGNDNDNTFSQSIWL